MLGAAAIQDTVLWSEPARKLLDAARAADPRAAGELTRRLAFDYRRPRQKAAIDWQDKRARDATLVEVAVDAQRALGAVQLAGRLPPAPAAGPGPAGAGRRRSGGQRGLAVLREIVGQEFDTSDDPDSPRPRKGRQVRQIISAHDPETRHGRKTN